jgi:hypothetical protein
MDACQLSQTANSWARAAALRTRGEIMKCFAPEQLPVLIATIVHDPTRRRLPLPVRIVLRLIGATDFMQLSTSRGQGVAS